MRSGRLIELIFGLLVAGASSTGWAVNGCNFAGVPAQTGNLSISNVGSTAYTVPCAHLEVGSQVTFTMNFSFHPFRGGTVSQGTVVPATSGPFTAGFNGPANSVTFTLTEAGEFGYYCSNHGVFGSMQGSIMVSPANRIFDTGFE